METKEQKIIELLSKHIYLSATNGVCLNVRRNEKDYKEIFEYFRNTGAFEEEIEREE